jgi:hypothetical protein
MTKTKSKPHVWVPKKYIEPTFDSGTDGQSSDTRFVWTLSMLHAIVSIRSCVPGLHFQGALEA